MNEKIIQCQQQLQHCHHHGKYKDVADIINILVIIEHYMLVMHVVVYGYGHLVIIHQLVHVLIIGYKIQDVIIVLNVINDLQLLNVNIIVVIVDKYSVQGMISMFIYNYYLYFRCSRFESEIRNMKIGKPVRVCQSCYLRLRAESL